jgi:glutathione S-transferase
MPVPTLHLYEPNLPQQNIIIKMLDYCGVEYEKKYEKFSGKIPEIDFYSGKVNRNEAFPHYVEDGTTFSNVSAILRYLAIKHDLYSKDADTLWSIDAITDLVLSLIRTNQKKSQSEKVNGEDFIRVLATVLENRLSSNTDLNGQDRKFIAGTDQPTLADFAVAGYYYTGTDAKH